MKLGTAASYFADTPVDGWSGTAWVKDVTTVTMLPYDRFISERGFGNKRRFLLVRPGDTTFDTYSVIKLPSGEVYLVGMHDSDIQVEEYSRNLLLHRAQFQVELFDFVKVTKASGMAGAVTRRSLGFWWGDAERITFSNSKEFNHISFTQSTLLLPRDCPIDTDNEAAAGGKLYTISESYTASGFRQCRAMAKKLPVDLLTGAAIDIVTGTGALA